MLSASRSAHRVLRALVWAGVLGAGTWAATAQAAPRGVLSLPEPITATSLDAPAILLPDTAPTSNPLVWIDWHGELRMRGERLSGVRLYFPTSGPARLDLRHNSDEAGLPTDGVMATADMRFRVEPVLHVGEWFEVRSQLDVAQGFVLGGNPAVKLVGSGYDLAEMYTGQAGQGAIPGGIGVRRLWVHARLFGLAELDIGRQPDHFGMGMLRNSGGDLLGDYQSDVDRVSLRGELFGLRLMLARDSLSAWPMTAAQGYADNAAGSTAGATIKTTQTGTGAVQYPLEDATDVTRYVLEARGGKPGLERGVEWGAALLWTTQTLGSFLENDTTADVKQKLATDTCFETGECVRLSPRNASFLTPQVAVDWRLGEPGNALRLQAEGAFTYGTLGQTDVLASSTAKTIVSGGLAARATWSRERTEWLLDAGFASGEGQGGFGVNDTNNFTRKVDDSQRTLLTGFRFHRNFRIDGILFRDIIGAVANAVYWKPAYRYHLSGGPQSSEGLAVEGSVVAAVAASATATPGGGSLLGVEPGVQIDYRQSPHSAGILRGSVLLPGGAFDDPTTHASAHTAWRVEAVWRLSF